MDQNQSDTSSTTQPQLQEPATVQNSEEPKFRVGDLAIFRFSGEESIELRCGLIRGQGEQEGTISVAWGSKVFNVPVMALVSTVDPVGVKGSLDAGEQVLDVRRAWDKLKETERTVRYAKPDSLGFGFILDDNAQCSIGPELAKASILALSTQAKLDVVNSVLKLLNTL